jgi:hypothetical protein
MLDADKASAPHRDTNFLESTENIIDLSFKNHGEKNEKNIARHMTVNASNANGSVLDDTSHTNGDLFFALKPLGKTQQRL